MASCLVPDFPAVLVALEHLKELDRDLAEDGARFGPEARPHLAQIAAAVSELEAERRAAHERLEVESIENSELRHKIQSVSEKMREEIEAEVAAALTPITDEIDRLRGDLRASSRLGEEAAEKQRELSEQNEALRPERDELQAEHEALLCCLQEEVTLKGRLRERLDQTREQTEKMKTHVADLHRDRLSLQESLSLEREASSAKGDELSREEDDVEERITQQRQAIGRRSGELEDVKKKKEEAGARLEELADHTSRLESGLQTLLATRRHCEEELEAEVQKHRELVRRGETLEEKPAELEEAFRLAVRRLQGEIETVEGGTEEARASGRRLREKVAAAREVDRRRRAEEARVRDEHSQVSQQLQRSGVRLDRRIAAIVRCNREVRETDGRIGELRDAAAVRETAFQRNREELGDDVRRERENVARLEDEEKRLARLLDELARAQEEHEAKMRCDIGEARRRREELRREEAEDAEADSLGSLVTETERKNKEVEDRNREDVEKCAEEAELLLRRNEEKRREVEETERLLEEVEKRHGEGRRRHEGLAALHRELVGVKTRLEASVRGLEEERAALLRQREEAKAELEEARERRALLLGKLDSELRAAEAKVYNVTARLEQVRAENSRLRLAAAWMTEEAERARRDRARCLRRRRRLVRDAAERREALREAWRREVVLADGRQASGAALLDGVRALLERLEDRRRRVGHVGSLLDALDFSWRVGDKTTAEEET